MVNSGKRSPKSPRRMLVALCTSTAISLVLPFSTAMAQTQPMQQAYPAAPIAAPAQPQSTRLVWQKGPDAYNNPVPAPQPAAAAPAQSEVTTYSKKASKKARKRAERAEAKSAAIVQRATQKTAIVHGTQVQVQQCPQLPPNLASTVMPAAPVEPQNQAPLKLIWQVGPQGHPLSQHSSTPAATKPDAPKKTRKPKPKKKPAPMPVVKEESHQEEIRESKKIVETAKAPPPPPAFEDTAPPAPVKPQPAPKPAAPLPPAVEQPAPVAPAPKPPAPLVPPAPAMPPAPVAPATPPAPPAPPAPNKQPAAVSQMSASEEVTLDISDMAEETPAAPSAPAAPKQPAPPPPPAPMTPPAPPAPPKPMTPPAPPAPPAPAERIVPQGPAAPATPPAPAAPVAATTAEAPATAIVSAPLIESKPAPADAKLAPDEVGSPSLRIVFKPTETSVPLSIKDGMAALVAKLKANEDQRATLVAYASGLGDQASTSRRVSLSRALSVRAALIEQGISPLRINVLAEGDKNPGGDPDRVDIFLRKATDKK